MTSATTILNTRDIIDVNRTQFMTSYESYQPYTRIALKRVVNRDPAPGRFQNDPTLGQPKGHRSGMGTLNPALGDDHHKHQSMMNMLGAHLSQTATQKVDGGGAASQRVEQVFKTDRSWR